MPEYNEYDDEDEVTEIDATKTPQGSITVTLDVKQWLNGSLESIIANALVDKVAGMLVKNVQEIVKERVLAMADEKFDALAREKMTEFFLKEHKKTTQWGDPTGEAFTMRELLLDRFQKFMAEKVDDKGNASNYSGNLPRSQWLLNTLAHKPLQEAINQTVTDIREKAKTAVQASVSRYIAEQLSPTINVPKIGG